jgi:hypothetical protein
MLLVVITNGCKTKDKIPSISTTEITNVTATSAFSGGTVTDEGSAPVTARGVCWSTGLSPTTADDKTEDNTGIGSYTSKITGLESGTIYYVRAYATNSFGTGYGRTLPFNTTGITTAEQQRIQNYISNHPDISFLLKPSGLYYCDSVVGTGLRATTHDEAYVKYTGKFLDETVFDTNVGKVDTLFFPVNEGWLIPGLDEGITYMNAGGKAILLLPSNLAYGIAGYYPVIPGNTSVIYEVYLVRLVVR